MPGTTSQNADMRKKTVTDSNDRSVKSIDNTPDLK